MLQEWLGNGGTVLGLGVALALVTPWLRGLGAWGVTVGGAALLGTAVWWEMGMTVPAALAGAGFFALGGWWLWPQLQGSSGQPSREFNQTLTALLTGERAWDAPTLTRLFRIAPPAELPRLRATLRYMQQQQPELRSLLTPFLEEP
ncbi:MAG: hypothetical protein Q6J44_06830 [Gloeomargarita sp. DG02_4_bins_56]